MTAETEFELGAVERRLLQLLFFLRERLDLERHEGVPTHIAGALPTLRSRRPRGDVKRQRRRIRHVEAFDRAGKI